MPNHKKIVFSWPAHFESEITNVSKVLNSGFVHGDGDFTLRATQKLKKITSAREVLLTTSGTHALEMASHLLGLNPGDEVILPSFTFSSGAAAIVAAGATPVFVDIEGETGNISADAVRSAVTPKTKAISVMHYGGQPVDMSSILKIAQTFDLDIIEDNAHGLGVNTELGVLGSIGRLGIQSFHDTKNLHCGEGGAILINDSSLLEAAEIMREKGTNRSKFLRGQVDKYTWVEWGSSYLPSELNAAVLDSQLDHFEIIQNRRHRIWEQYRSELVDWAENNSVYLMSPPGGIHAAHVFYLLMPNASIRDQALDFLRRHDIMATFHYVPLHNSPAGLKYGNSPGSFFKTIDFTKRQIRLPLFTDMTENDVSQVIETLKLFKFNS